MIHKDMTICWMDISKNIVKEGSIDEFFRSMAFRVNYSDPSMPYIKFNQNDIVKVTDWKGWTDVEYITKISNMVSAYRIETVHGKYVICSDNQILPVYDPTKKAIGFHGESLFEFDTVRSYLIKEKDILRVRHCVDENTNDIFFDEVCRVIQVDDNDEWYVMKTKHGWYNCNDIYISDLTNNEFN